MASLDWTKINKDIIVAHTKKRFYGQYFYKLTYYVPGVRLITYGEPGALTDRVNSYNFRNSSETGPSNYWIPKYRETADYKQLVDFMAVYHCKSPDLKFRVEGNTFNVYTRTEQEIYNIAENNLQKWNKSLQIVTLVESPSAMNLLEKGYILVKSQPDYAYRIKIKEGFRANNYKPLANYLKNLGVEVKLSKHLISYLERNDKYFRGGYVYVNDLRLVDMLKLISPDSIGSIDHMVIQ